MCPRCMGSSSCCLPPRLRRAGEAVAAQFAHRVGPPEPQTGDDRVRWRWTTAAPIYPGGLRTPNDALKPGSLPALLVVLTITTGLIDAVSVLGLGRVFTANMTGNIVFLGFALARVPEFSARRSLAALAAFLIGAVIGGRLGMPLPGSPPRLRADRTVVATSSP